MSCLKMCNSKKSTHNETSPLVAVKSVSFKNEKNVASDEGHIEISIELNPPKHHLHMKDIVQLRRAASELGEEEELVLGLEAPEKSIGSIGSFSLIANNIAGPGMMSLPHIFANAGYLPSIICILWVYFGSSLCGTLLADAISSLPGNSDFTQNIEFSLAFRLIGGDMWYVLAEYLFVLSCMVQCSSGIVEAAHSLDAVIASLVLGKTYAIQMWPSIAFVTWSPDDCSSSHVADDVTPGASGSCTPFYYDGPLVISLGYVLTVAMFFPLGRGHLKENVTFQVLSFLFFLGVTCLFFREFIFSTGLNYSLPAIGNDVGPLVGVVLFNYAYAITIPAWLNEKKTDVNVKQTIWGATSVLTGMYILFGLFGAMAFSYPPADMLSMLGSNQSDVLTRVCAALFGVIIIGCGIPIYCVLIKNTLYAGRTCDVHLSFFIGAVFPYLVSWTMYQGTVMISVLSWAGLVVNGIVAFLLPLVLALFTFQVRKKSLVKLKALQDKGKDISSLVTRTPSGRVLALLSSRLGPSALSSLPTSAMLTSAPLVANDADTNGVTRDKDEVESWDDEDLVLDGSVYPLYSWIIPFQEQLVYFMLVVFSVLIVGTIVQNAVRATDNLTDDNGTPLNVDDYLPDRNTP